MLPSYKLINSITNSDNNTNDKNLTKMMRFRSIADNESENFEYEYEGSMDDSFTRSGDLPESIVRELDSPLILILEDEDVGMSQNNPYIYEGGRAPKVPFIKISPNVGEIQDSAFRDNDVIERLVIPKKVTHMGKFALAQCINLKYLIFEKGSSLRHIGLQAFAVCQLIEELNLPASLKTLGKDALYGCYGLKKVTFSSPKMTAIEDYTFWGCSSLTVVEGMNAIQSIGGYAFYGCSSLETIDVNQSADIAINAFFGCTQYTHY
jgi:hypothetical protein